MANIDAVSSLASPCVYFGTLLVLHLVGSNFLMYNAMEKNTVSHVLLRMTLRSETRAGGSVIGLFRVTFGMAKWGAECACGSRGCGEQRRLLRASTTALSLAPNTHEG